MVLTGDVFPAVGRRLRSGGRPPAPDSATRFFAESQQVARTYRLPPYDGPVTYYLAEGRLPVVGNSLSAWRRVAPRLQVTEVPGYHWDIDERRTGLLGARFAGVLAEKVSASLR
jgi:acetoacetyl-CoA synthetase